LCWQELTAEQRLPHYRNLWMRWIAIDNDSRDCWPAIKAAVLAGE
jgi:hypothetical protein